ncbi:uncharacterized protein TNCV_3395421 [Trichonephila clavipes]|nr:uncharacterized protein TNCV_3395421 [Trichonephila clavipes]
MTLFVNQYLTSITVMEHPPYSPDLALCDFFSFSTVKSCLKGSIQEVQAKTENLLKGLPTTSFQNSYQKWQNRMQKCMNVDGDCFEGDNVLKN